MTESYPERGKQVMRLFKGEKLDGWRKIYGIWIGERVFIGLSIAPKGERNE